MRVLVWLLIVLVTPAMACSGRSVVRAQEASADPDRLYAEREQLPRALEAASIWASRLQSNQSDFEAAWKLARAAYWLGGHVSAAERRPQYERGITAANRAIALRPDRPEGHFWLAANMGVMAEAMGALGGLKYKNPVKRELETTLAIDASFLQGSADRALGRWYLKVPALFGGSKTKSIEHLQRSLTYDPSSAASHLFLADTYTAMKRWEDVRRELQLVLDAPATAEWAPEVREFQQQARARLQALRR